MNSANCAKSECFSCYVSIKVTFHVKILFQKRVLITSLNNFTMIVLSVISSSNDKSCNIIVVFFRVRRNTNNVIGFEIGNFKFDATQLNKLNKQIFDIGCNHRNKHFF